MTCRQEVVVGEVGLVQNEDARDVSLGEHALEGAVGSGERDACIAHLEYHVHASAVQPFSHEACGLGHVPWEPIHSTREAEARPPAAPHHLVHLFNLPLSFLLSFLLFFLPSFLLIIFTDFYGAHNLAELLGKLMRFFSFLVLKVKASPRKVARRKRPML